MLITTDRDGHTHAELQQMLMTYGIRDAKTQERAIGRALRLEEDIEIAIADQHYRTDREGRT